MRKRYGEVIINLLAFLAWHWTKISGQLHAPVILLSEKDPPMAIG
jgi:hypothetical protein